MPKQTPLDRHTHQSTDIFDVFSVDFFHLHFAHFTVFLPKQNVLSY